jgi:hypothetical protein
MSLKVHFEEGLENQKMLYKAEISKYSEQERNLKVFRFGMRSPSEICLATLSL